MLCIETKYILNAHINIYIKIFDFSWLQTYRAKIFCKYVDVEIIVDNIIDKN